ncbi:DUF3267 domain-containing protein [Marivirga harenae]|uniref:DUF3267 domain-containing protein n=1 Tax=Marivirga harenae TaxID=2010992 RepID=UPI0026DF8BDF|nr:DUF3267 domain-containing protein [Marivirga harenae]WKV10524.1 DUF3267 domain-containing protein [Marivirga harenae]
MSPELLKNKSQYKNVLSIMDSSEWLLFISTFIRRKNSVTRIYWVYLFVGLLAGVYMSLSNNVAEIEHRIWIVGLTGGLLLSLLISPVLHELVHALSFKFFGAKTINFRWNWNLFRFNVQANDFVLSKKSYFLICAFTFFLFSVIPLMAAFYATGVWLFVLLSLSFFHALYALKDLAVCSYLYKFPNCYIYSSDEDKTIFYKSLP